MVLECHAGRRVRGYKPVEAVMHKSICDRVVTSLTRAYKSLRIGNPLNADNHMGPLIDTSAVAYYRQALNQVVAQGIVFDI